MTDGVLEAEDPQLHALCYLRSLDGLDETHLGDTNGLRHIDGLKVDGKVSWCPGTPTLDYLGTHQCSKNAKLGGV